MLSYKKCYDIVKSIQGIGRAIAQQTYFLQLISSMYGE